jgi:hypothetical protein
MKHRKKIIIAVLLVILIILGNLWNLNLGPFQGNSVAGLRDGHFRIMDTWQSSHFDLLFHRYGGIEFNHFGRGVHAFIAHYQWGVLVLQEQVASSGGTTEDWYRNGSVLWGITMEDSLPKELRVDVQSGGTFGRNHFDFSSFDFEVGTIAPPPIISGQIERGRPYTLQSWHSPNSSFRTDGNRFHPEILRESANTVILYIVFK